MVNNFVGFSVRGPAHIQKGTTNQDFWIGAHCNFGELIAVCDGVGCCKHADIGSSAACYAVYHAFSMFYEANTQRIAKALHLNDCINAESNGESNTKSSQSPFYIPNDLWLANSNDSERTNSNSSWLDSSIEAGLASCNGSRFASCNASGLACGVGKVCANGSCYHEGSNFSYASRVDLNIFSQDDNEGRELPKVSVYQYPKSSDLITLSKELITLIYENWLKFIGRYAPEDCGTTCLFAAHLKQHKAYIVAQYGDGLVGLSLNKLKRAYKVSFPHNLSHQEKKISQSNTNESTYISIPFDENTSDFSNITNAFSNNYLPCNWNILWLPEPLVNGVMLTTDGVSDDLQKASRKLFVNDVMHLVQTSGRKKAIDELAKALSNWPTPKHSDDKTIACLYRT